VPTGPGKVRFQGRIGRHLFALSSSQFDPYATSPSLNRISGNLEYLRVNAKSKGW
jgi:hypothetical protein